jgi:hypothetical protein
VLLRDGADGVVHSCPLALKLALQIADEADGLCTVVFALGHCCQGFGFNAGCHCVFL